MSCFLLQKSEVLILVNILVVGANGLIGSVIYNCLLQDPILDLRTMGLARSSENSDILVSENKYDYHHIISQLKPSIVIFCIGSASVDFAEKDPLSSFQVNYRSITEYIDMTIDELSDVKIILISSIYVYSELQGQSACYSSLDMPYPSSVYGVHKYALENYLISRSCNYVIVRLPFVVGGNLSKNDFFNTLLNARKENKKIKLSSNSLRYPTDVEYVAKAIRFLIVSNVQNSIIHISSECAISKYHLAKDFLLFCGYEYEDILLDSNHDEIWVRPLNLRLIPDKFSSNLGIAFDRRLIYDRYLLA